MPAVETAMSSPLKVVRQHRVRVGVWFARGSVLEKGPGHEMAEACRKAEARAKLAGSNQIDFLADVGARDARGRSRDHRAATVIQSVVCIRQPVPAVTRSRAPALRDGEVETTAHVLHVLPADKIGETVLVVAGRIELIESAFLVVGRVLVTA